MMPMPSTSVYAVAAAAVVAGFLSVPAQDHVAGAVEEDYGAKEYGVAH